MNGWKTLVIGATILAAPPLLSGCGSTYALNKGDFSAAAGQTELNLEYDYQGMSVGDFDTEAAYIEHEVAEHEEDEPGSGETWRAEWSSNREAYFQPAFEEKLNEYLVEKGVSAAPGRSSATYTLVLKTLHTEIGWNAGIMRRPALIDVRVTLVKTDDPSAVLAELHGEEVPGSDAWGFDYAIRDRLTHAYRKAGKELGKYLLDNGL